MFLLSKLDEVSRVFPEDVERTREFLLDRGIPARSLEALPHFSARLAIDPSFRRDVTSLVQVVIRREEETVDYMDLLGILVVAAAGTETLDGNDEQEEAVREILRFLTQVRRPTGAVGPVFVRSQNVVPLVVAVEPPTSERASPPVVEDHGLPVRQVSMPFYQLAESNPSRWRGAAVWIAGAMALAVALGSGWMIYQKGHATPQTTAVLGIVPSSNMAVDEKGERTIAPARRLQKLQVPVSRRPPPPVARSLNDFRTLPTEPRMTEDAPSAGSLQPLDAGRSLPPASSTLPAKSAIPGESHAVTKPLNAEPESAAKSTPPVSTTTASTPSVRRRLPRPVEINPPPSRRPTRSPESLSAALGVVHPASIGMMASNLISSPAPAYPAAASQAQVQGEVTVRAVVDREGKVIDARVVSGPELLRDASLEAVQQWRYRPYMQGGKPAEVATTAILDFELP